MSETDRQRIAERFSDDEQVSRAVDETLAHHQRLGHEVVARQDGKAVWLSPASEEKTPNR
jgi:hypothetical protein